MITYFVWQERAKAFQSHECWECHVPDHIDPEHRTTEQTDEEKWEQG